MAEHGPAGMSAETKEVRIKECPRCHEQVVLGPDVQPGAVLSCTAPGCHELLFIV